MTLQWIPLEALEPHPENANRMPPRLLEKLKGHIRRTGLYEPLVVRPLGGDCRLQNVDCRMEGQGSAAVAGSLQSAIPNLQSTGGAPPGRYQILNGHHRARALGDLGHTHARCDVWEVDDDEARVLLATLNRLEGRDDPTARALLVTHLAEGRSAADLARLLPEPPDAVERLLRLATPPPAPVEPADLAPLPRPMTFFLSEEQHAAVVEALREARRGGPAGEKPDRARALERLALWYLEARNLR